jgi:hypothetical protein
LSSKPGEGNTLERRKVLVGAIGFVLNAYLESNSLLNATGLATSALNQYDQHLSKQEAEMRAMVGQIESLRATFENGKLVVHVDRITVLGLVERMIKKYFSVSEAGMTAEYRIDSGPGSDKDHDAELRLPDRSIYLKFVPKGIPVEAFANWFLQRARRMNPSEYWLLIPTEEIVDIPFEPIFTEARIMRGRLKTYPLTNLLSELVGMNYDLEVAEEVDGGFRFVISRKQGTVPAS